MPVVVAPNGGLNCYWPMPFLGHARVTVKNHHPGEIPALYYQFDYGVDADVGADDAYFHAQWRRENPTTPGEDHTILEAEGVGHYVGTFLDWTALSGGWWGEGELKCYIDGDEEHPTICGTGTEDYVGGAWSFARETGAGDREPVTYSTPFLGYHAHDRDNDTDGRRATSCTAGTFRTRSASGRICGSPSSRSRPATASGPTTSPRWLLVPDRATRSVPRPPRAHGATPPVAPPSTLLVASPSIPRPEIVFSTAFAADCLRRVLTKPLG